MFGVACEVQHYNEMDISLETKLENVFHVFFSDQE